MERNEKIWRAVTGSITQHYKMGFNQFHPLWKTIFCLDCYEQIKKTAKQGKKSFHLPTETWVQVLYELAATFHAWPTNRHKLLDLVTPLYYDRVASFVHQTKDRTSQQAEELVEQQAQPFKDHKYYLVKVWEAKAKAKAKEFAQT